MSPPIEQKPITMAELQTEPPPAEVQIPPHWQLDEPIPRGDFRQWRKRTFAKWADWGLLSPESKKAIEEDNASADDSEESADEDEAKKDKKEPKCDDSHPFRYSVVFFQPGFNIQGLEDGKSRVYSDGGALTIGFDKMNALVRGYANYFGDGSIGWTPPVVGSAEDTDNSNDTILSLGHFGVVVVKILNGYLVDSPGPDFTVTENPFYDKRRPGTYYIERGVAGVAEEWGSFREFECSLEPVTEVDQEGNVRRTYPGCAGNYPMIIGGDQFDLVNLGDKMPKKIRYIMVRDMGLSDRSAYDNKEGFDLDSLLILGKICDDSAAATEGGLL